MTDQLMAHSATEEDTDQDELSELPEDPETGFTFISREQGERLIDRQARTYHGLSGAEFKLRYRAGTMDYEDADVIRVAMLLPFGED